MSDVIPAKAPNRYRSGRDFEYRVRDWLRKAGFFVTRSPASKSPVDVIAISKADGVFLIQCKRNGALPSSEWNALHDLADSIGATPILAKPGPRGKGPGFFELLDVCRKHAKSRPIRPIFLGPV